MDSLQVPYLELQVAVCGTVIYQVVASQHPQQIESNYNHENQSISDLKLYSNLKN